MKGELYDVKKVSDLVEAYCVENKISRAEYASLLGIEPGSLSRITAGKGSSVENLAKIAALGKISIKDLLNETPDSIKNELQLSGEANNLPVCV